MPVIHRLWIDRSPVDAGVDRSQLIPGAGVAWPARAVALATVPMLSTDLAASSNKALTRTQHNAGKKKYSTFDVPLISKERGAVTFALDEGESEVEVDELMYDDDIPEEPQISRKGKPDRAGKLIIRLKPPSKTAFTPNFHRRPPHTAFFFHDFFI